jgi:hypothetical protein
VNHAKFIPKGQTEAFLKMIMKPIAYKPAPGGYLIGVTIYQPVVF